MSWNRETVREFNRKHKTKYTKQELEAIDFALKLKAGNLNVKSMDDLALNPYIRITPPEPIPEDTEVKLNYEVITKRVNYPTLSQKYKDFIEIHRNEILHITNENAKEGYVCVKEDESKIWLWAPLFDLLYRDETGNFVKYEDSILSSKEVEDGISNEINEGTASV